MPTFIQRVARTTALLLTLNIVAFTACEFACLDVVLQKKTATSEAVHGCHSGGDVRTGGSMDVDIVGTAPACGHDNVARAAAAVTEPPVRVDVTTLDTDMPVVVSYVSIPSFIQTFHSPPGVQPALPSGVLRI